MKKPRSSSGKPPADKPGASLPAFATQGSAGTLRSGLDEPDHLLPAFDELIGKFHETLGRYERGLLSDVELADALSKLWATDTVGTRWTLGARSGQWYFRDATGAWVPATPPAFDPSQLTATSDAPVAPVAPEAPPLDVAEPLPVLTDIGHLLAEEDVWPEVQDTGSAESLPEFSHTTSVIDEHGVWDTSFTTASSNDDAAAPTDSWAELAGLASTLGEEGPAEDPDGLGLPPELFQ